MPFKRVWEESPMFDLGSWGEFLIIVVAVFILIGPKEMPALLRTLGRWTYRVKKALNQFRQTYDVYFQEGEIEEYIKETNQSVMQDEEPGKDPVRPSVKKEKGEAKELSAIQNTKASRLEKEQDGDT